MKYKDHINSEYWITVSKAVKARSGWKCQICNSPHDLNAHHRTYEHMGYELEHLDDLVCLCRRCHAIFNGKDGGAQREQIFPQKLKERPSQAQKEMRRAIRDSVKYNHEADMPDGDPIIVTNQLKKRLLTYAGGVTNATINALGIPLPLKGGWFKDIIGKPISRDSFRRALQGRETFGRRLGDE